ncbi:VanZ family protein [Tahibacter amnicola]|uniref:VanZ family protein n=1 Tax=Tahibacter amnicola TaxID=2976241 RepID=A0ABY6BDW7_9GAMM|nr:VanZ family protein [Tahibacter amnicola]UXI68226.1 VanZ family protein [Tahibacter amnicola]
MGRLLLVAMLVVCLLPAPAVVGEVPMGDKFAHLAGFAALMGWYAQIYAAPADRLRCAVGAVAFGGLIELLQALVPYRAADGMDLAADALGVLLGWALATSPLGNLLSRLEARVPA